MSGSSFVPLHGKGPILNDAPRKAAGILKQNPDDWVFAVPDLYPMAQYDKTHPHRSFRELVALLQRRFTSCADELGLPRRRATTSASTA